MPDAAEAAIAGGDFGFEYGARGLAEQQIDVADDTGADRGRPVAAARAHRRDAVGELDLADRAERFRPVSTIHRAAVDIDGRNHIVSGGEVVGDLLDQIALAAAVPQMMMGIDDWPAGIDDFFRMQGEPVLARIGIEPALRCRRSAADHGSLLPDWRCFRFRVPDPPWNASLFWSWRPNYCAISRAGARRTGPRSRSIS